MPTTNRRILLVDDDSDIRDSLREILEGEDYVVTGAANGLEALACLQNAPAPPALILLDVMMPLMNGMQFRLEQKKNPAWSKIPVIVLSATNREALGSPVDLEEMVCLQKPLNLTMLLQLISSRVG